MNCLKRFVLEDMLVIAKCLPVDDKVDHERCCVGSNEDIVGREAGLGVGGTVYVVRSCAAADDTVGDLVLLTILEV